MNIKIKLSMQKMLEFSDQVKTIMINTENALMYKVETR